NPPHTSGTDDLAPRRYGNVWWSSRGNLERSATVRPAPRRRALLERNPMGSRNGLQTCSLGLLGKSLELVPLATVCKQFRIAAFDYLTGQSCPSAGFGEQ